MLSFDEFYEHQEAARLLASIDIDPEKFAEWAIANPEVVLSEGPMGTLTSMGMRGLGKAAGWGGRQAWNVAKWGGRHAADAVKSGMDTGMQGINNAGQAVTRGANNYQQWRDPLSRLNDADRALQKVVASYGDHRVNGNGAPVSSIIAKIHRTIDVLRQSIEYEKGGGTYEDPQAQAGTP